MTRLRLTCDAHVVHVKHMSKMVQLRNVPDALHEKLRIRAALAGMSLFDRAVALTLTECSVVKTSRRMGISSAAVYRAIGGLRLALSELGFAGRHRRWAACRRNSDPRSRTGQTEVRL